MDYRIFDTETTGLVDPEPTEIACLVLNNDMEEVYQFDTLVRPKKPISYPAMGMTNITNEMVEKAPLLEDVVDKVSPKQGEILVGHNIKFDLRVMGEGFKNGCSVIDTYELAKEFLDKEKTGDFKNSTLYYYFGGEPVHSSHRALGDCRTTAFILKKFFENFPLTVDKAVKISERIFTSYKICHFKKWENTPWKYVVTDDKGYCQWLMDNGKITDPKELEYLNQLGIR